MRNTWRKFLPRSELRLAGGGMASNRAMSVLIVADVAFILLYVVTAFLFQQYEIHIHQFLYFNTEDSLASIWGYAKYGFALALFYAIFRETRNVGYGLLFAILLIFLLDDAAELHDRFGRALSSYLDFGPFAGLEGQDRGESVVYVFMALIIFTLLYIAFGYLKSSDMQTFINFTWVIFLLATFGAAFDVVHAVFFADAGFLSVGDVVATAIEDGGELLSVSLFVFVGLDRLLVHIYDQRE
jgi:hypothetical protein